MKLGEDKTEGVLRGVEDGEKYDQIVRNYQKINTKNVKN